MKRLRIIFDQSIGFIKNPNLIFYTFLLAFLIDSFLNYYFHVPFFIAVQLLMLPILWLGIFFQRKYRNYLIIFILAFAFSWIYSTIDYGFFKVNLSDVSFIMMLGSALLYYFSFREKLKNSAVYMLLFVSIFLVSGTFFNFNSGSWSANALISENSPEQIRVRDKKKAAPPAKDKKTTVKKRKRYPKPKRAGINREYNNGFFRVPHVANYFLGLLTLFLGYRLFNQRKWLDAILFVTALSLMVYTGVRTFIIAFALASVIFLLRKKTKYVALGLIVMAALIIIFRYELHHLLGDNIIGSYSFMLINLIDNPEGVTRFAMIKSWWHELPEFSFWELMFGKGFTHSVVFNTRQNNLETWFHNDYTSISYAYGLLGTLAYIGLYAFIFVRFRKIIRANYFIFVYFLSIIFMAAITGFYFFYPALLMFPFVLMVNEESNKGAHIKSHNS